MMMLMTKMMLVMVMMMTRPMMMMKMIMRPMLMIRMRMMKIMHLQRRGQGACNLMKWTLVRPSLFTSCTQSFATFLLSLLFSLFL